jgi:pyruvate dehydrogenase E2 component (dihydrolipoamide acetyltransferase)
LEVRVKAVVMPALGVAMSEGLLLQWLKAAGETVAAGEPIMEIETDKTTMDVESPVAGVVGPHLFEAGAVVPVGVAMVEIIEEGDASGSAVSEAVAIPPTSPGDAPGAPQSPAGLAAPADAPERGEVELTPGQRMPNRLSPRERRMAREREQQLAAGAADALDHALPAAPADTAPAERSPMTGAATGRHRELIAAKVSESWRTIPHFAVSREVDAAAMQTVRTRWGNASTRPSFTDLMLRALALALRAGGEPGAIDVGLAVATPNGVAIPVVRGVLALDLGGLRNEREAAVSRARGGRLRPSDLTEPPRSTLSNLGTEGIDSFTGVIALGQMSLLTVGRILPRPWATGGGLFVRDSFFATLNVDHRQIDGADAARLLVAFVAAVEDAAQLESEVVSA